MLTVNTWPSVPAVKSDGTTNDPPPKFIVVLNVVVPSDIVIVSSASAVPCLEVIIKSSLVLYSILADLVPAPEPPYEPPYA